MALRFSTGLRDAVAGGYSWRHALANGRLKIFSGTQPASADDAATGTLLVTFTLSGGAFTGETRSAVSVQLGGTSGSVDSITVGGAIPIIGSAVNFNTDLTTTAAALAAEINNYRSLPDFTATSSGDTVTIYAPWGLGADGNGLTISVGTTTLTATINGGTSATFGGTGAPAAGVSAVNGLNWQPPSGGVLTKEPTVWQGTAVADGTAGWFRFEADPNDDQGSSTTFRRFDGSIATNGADLNVASTSITNGSIQTINTFTITIPAS